MPSANSGKLVQHEDCLALEIPGMKPFWVDFEQAQFRHRQRLLKTELIAKAVGAKDKPLVCDATAGFGRDSFLLACLGCKVQMIERSEIIAALLADGLKRLGEDNLQLWVGDAKQILLKLPEQPDVVYLDPMFPERSKSALVKKDMQILQQLVGSDDNVEELLQVALQATKQRVVIKRPAQAPWVSNLKPHHSYQGQTTRFDIYLKN